MRSADLQVSAMWEERAPRGSFWVGVIIGWNFRKSWKCELEAVYTPSAAENGRW